MTEPASTTEGGGAGYDAFLSYSSRADYHRARRVEAFLESLHQTPVPLEASLRQLQICRDGSDFRLPGHRGDELQEEELRDEELQEEEEKKDDPVWQIIRPELASEERSVLVSRVIWRDLVAYLRGLTSATLTVEQRIVSLGETEAEARKAYEAEERRYGRTPLPPDWSFDYPF